MNTTYKRHLTGKRGEDQATSYLIENGYTILERNWFMRIGEIDIIAQKEGVIYFFEVKARSGLKYGHPFHAINRHRRHILMRLGLVYVADRGLKYRALSVGAIGIIGNHLTILPNIDKI